MTTVYFAGTEDVSFTLANATVLVGGTFSRPAFSRAAISINSGSTAYPPSGYALTPAFAPISSFWVHGQLNNQIVGNITSSGLTLIGVNDSGGVGRILVQGTGTAGQVKLCTRNAAGAITTLVTSAAGALPSTGSSTTPIDLFINYSTSGQVKLLVAGVSIADTGAGVNVTTDSATTLAQVLYGTLSSGSEQTVWSECLVQDTSTLGAAVQTIPPVAAGNTQSWTPNTVGNVNPATINDTNFVGTTSANALSEWTVATTLPAGSWTIEAVVQAARVSVGSSGPQHFEWLVRTIDGSDHVAGSVAPLVGTFADFGPQVWPTNPHTSAAWNPGELINAGIESLA